MKARRMLTVLAAVCLTSFALVAASAQAAPAPNAKSGGGAQPAKHVKGAKPYEFYFLQSGGSEYEDLGEFDVCPKTHTWGFGGACEFGTYEATKVKIKINKETEKYTYVYFDYYGGERYLFAYE